VSARLLYWLLVAPRPVRWLTWPLMVLVRRRVERLACESEGGMDSLLAVLGALEDRRRDGP
jgi:hypothetical protein